MKSRPKLEQHLPLVNMISIAKDFCESMLRCSDSLYPFAVMATNTDVRCIFTPCEGQYAQTNMIESLQTQIEGYKSLDLDLASLLVYAADIVHPDNSESKALVFTITDTQGHNNLTIYPFERTKTGLVIRKPSTCDFLD